MSSFTTSPNMSLQIPTVGVEPGPLYATDVNNSLNTIDGHNHSAGSGVLVTPSGLNINSDLPINGNSITLLFTSRFQSQASPIPNTAPNIGCIYVAGNELYYNDYSGGHIVQITNNGSVNAGAGSITGLPSGTASVSFASSTYVFQSATNVAANLDAGSIVLRNTTPSSNGLTLSPPNAIGANYTLTLPTLPSVTSVMTLATSGNMGTVTYDQVGENMTSAGADAIGQSMTSTGANAVAASRTRTVSNPAPEGGIAEGGSSGTFTTGSTSPQVIPNSSVTITTAGRPVWVQLIGASNANSSISGNASVTGGLNLVNQTTGNSVAHNFGASFSSGGDAIYPASSFSWIDFPVAGTYTYFASIYRISGASSVTANNVSLAVYEL